MKWVNIKDKPPPIDVGILVTDGQITTICCIIKWEDRDRKRYSMNGHGFGGYEWEFDFDYEDITHWMPLPKPPKTQDMK